MRITDNNYKGLSITSPDQIEDLRPIANRPLKLLQEENPNLVVFPELLGGYNDHIEHKVAFQIEENRLFTNNMMGFVGRNTTKLTITSRFESGGNDYFLHYMLQKVLSINVFDFQQNTKEESIWDFWLYLFPYCLKKAYAQGLYKAYQQHNYNDTNVKGTIDIKRHLLKNIPFMGRITYSTREHSYDNPLSQLIRHTIEYLSVHPIGAILLHTDTELRAIIDLFILNTQNTYNKNARHKVILSNSKPFAHPYFTEYALLQKICLRILRREQLSFGQEKDNIYGLLFDGAWLWEEYLNTFLKEDFEHPENLTGKNKKYLFKNKKQSIYPDFLSKQSPKIVGDAKYMPLNDQDYYQEGSERITSIYYKTIAYMYRFESTCGFLLYPIKEDGESLSLKTYEIEGDTQNRKLGKIGLGIPQQVENFSEFVERMKINETALKQFIRRQRTAADN